jgi:stearoyl-CoA desaturase (Delta-9 desaturase)
MTGEPPCKQGPEQAVTTTGPAGRRGAPVGIPFAAVHVGLLAIPFVGWSPVALACCGALYAIRSFGITVVYHRGLAHRSFSMSRPVQALGAAIGASAGQRGPLWWVANHRTHHRFADRPGDPHSPVVSGFLHGHLGWLFESDGSGDRAAVSDLERFPELRLLDRYHHVAPIATALALCAFGAALHVLAPSLGTSGPQMLVWGFFVSTTLLYHCTFAVNSVCHRFGGRRFATNDGSRNNVLVALVAMGEGWHNNHHRFPRSPRHGFARYEMDPSWWIIRAMAALGMVSRLAPVPSRPPGERGSAASRMSPRHLHAHVGGQE